MSPPVSPSADLQSIMPAPVRSRSSLTICAVMLAIAEILDAFGGRHPGFKSGPGPSADLRELKLNASGTGPESDPGPARRTTSSLGGELLGLRDPAFHAAGQPDLLADLVGGLGEKAAICQ